MVMAMMVVRHEAVMRHEARGVLDVALCGQVEGQEKSLVGHTSMFFLPVTTSTGKADAIVLSKWLCSSLACQEPKSGSARR